MAWYDEDSWLTAAFSPNLTTIIITLIVALGLPVLLHSFLYRKAAATATLPTFLLVGPSGGGKTAFTTLVCSCNLSEDIFILEHVLVSHIQGLRSNQPRPSATPSPKHTPPRNPSQSKPSSQAHTSQPPHTTAPPATQPSSARAASSCLTRPGTANCGTMRPRSSRTPRTSEASYSWSTQPPLPKKQA